MKKLYTLLTVLLVVFLFNSISHAQTVAVEIDAYDYTMLNGGWATNCGGNDAWFGCTNREPDPQIFFAIRANDGANGTAQWSQFTWNLECNNYAGFGGGNQTLYNVPYSAFLRAQVWGYEYDGEDFGCASNNDGNCNQGNANGSTGYRYIQWEAPCSWSSVWSSDRNGCSSDDVTENYRVRWRYRWHYTSGYTAGSVNYTANYTNCANYDIPNITQTGESPWWTQRQWQVSVNGGGYTNIAGATGNTYDPPNQGEGTYRYRCVYWYYTSFCGTSWDAAYTGTWTIQSVTNNPGAAYASPSTTACVGTPASILSSVNASTGSPSSGGVTYHYYYKLNCGANGEAWVNYQSTSANSSSLPAAVINTPGTHCLARNSQFPCTGQANNSSTIDFTITIGNDGSNPSTTAPANQILVNSPNNSCDGAIILNDPSVSDNCAGVSGTENLLPSSGLVLWTRADAGIRTDDNGKVIQWSDLSGSGNDITQQNPGLAPVLATNAINGNPAVRFNTAQFMTTATSFTNPYTILTVSKMNNGTDRRLISSANGNWLMGYWSGNQDVMHAGGWNSAPPGPTPDNLPQMYAATSTGSNVVFYNKGYVLSPSGGGNLQLGRLQLNSWNNGTSESSDGDIAEVIVYNRVLSAAERQKIEGYLAYKYNMQVPLASMQAAQNYNVGNTTVNYRGGDLAGNISNATGTITTNNYQGPTVTPSLTTVCANGSVTMDITGMAPSKQTLNAIGTDDYLESTSNIPIGSNWTIESWFKAPLINSGSNWNTLIRGTSYHHIIVDRSSMEIGSYVGGFRSSGFNLNQLSSGWHHLAAVGTGGNTIFYIDGIKVGVVEGYQATDNVRSIGNHWGNGQAFGPIDEVRIWNTALDQKEINNYMATEVTSSHPNWGNMLAYYKMDNNGSNSRSGSYNGTLRGGVGFINTDYYNYVWSGPAGSTYSNNNNTSETTDISNPSSGTYNVYATANGCNSTSTGTAITVTPTPVGNTTVSANNVCVGAIVTFNTSISPGAFVRYQYQWNGTNPSLWNNWGTTQTYNWTASTSGGNILYVRTQLSNGVCTNVFTNPISVQITEDPSSPTLNTASPTSGSSVCVGATLSATLNNGIDGLSCSNEYQYSVNGGSTWGSYTSGSNLTATNTGTNAVIIQGRRLCSGTGCDGAGENWVTLAQWTVVADPSSPTLNTASPLSGTSVCVGASLSATLNNGTGGLSCSDNYQYSLNGGSTWATYTSGSNLTATNTGTNAVIIQGRRLCSGTACDGAGENWVTLAQWTVAADPTAPTLNTATPASGNSVCVGGTVSATFNAGSGGTGCADEYQFSVDGGSNWLPYTAGSSIAATTIGTNTIRVQGRRDCSGNGCDGAAETFTLLAQWSVAVDPASPSLNTATPASGSSVCIGGIVSATLNGGTGGVGCFDEFQYTRDGGSTWLAYTSGNNITANNIGTNEIVIQGRRVCTGGGCNGTNWLTIAQWTVMADPVAPTLNTANPTSGSDVCEGAVISVTLNSGSDGALCADQYQYTYSGGGGGGGVVTGGTITIATAGKAGQTINLETRRICAGNGCDGAAETYSSVATWTVVSDPIAPTLNVATPTVVTTVCIGGVVSATFNAGSSGAGTCSDLYQYSVDGGSNWLSYTPGNNITATTSGTNTIIIQGRRDCNGIGCDGVGETFTTLAQWSVAPDPIAPTLNTANPTSGNSVCVGGTVSATFNAGSGGTGTCTDQYQYSVDGGSNWLTYTAGSNITATTVGSNTIVVQGRRDCDGNGCVASSYVTLAQWTVVADPLAPTLNTATPASGSSVCIGGIVSATFNIGSGGLSCTDEYQYSVDGGSNWLAYTPGSNITATTAGANTILVQGRRNCSENGCDGAAETFATLAQWTVAADPSAPTLNTAAPASGTSICIGAVVSATFNAGSGGLSCADDYRYSVDGGTSWASYTSGSNITTTSAGVNQVVIQGRRTCSGLGCNDPGYVTLAQWTVVADPVAPTINTATPTSGSNVCGGTDVLVTFNAGSGGLSCTDEYSYTYSGGGGSSNVIPGGTLSISTTGKEGETITLQIRRDCGGNGCDGAAETFATVATWTVIESSTPPTSFVSDPVEVCSGGAVDLTAPDGSLGTGAMWYLYDTDPTVGSPVAIQSNSNPTPDFSVTNITTTTTFYVRAEGTCNESATQSVTVNVILPPVSGTVTKSPNQSSICVGHPSVSATFGAGSQGGSTFIDVNEYKIGVAGTWTAYSGSINTSALAVGTVVFVRTYRSTLGNNCSPNPSTPTEETWVVDGTNSAINIFPDVNDVCAGSPIELTFAGTVGSGSQLEWYTETGGGGFLIGNSNPITIYPTKDSIVYAYLSGGACPTDEVNEAIWVYDAADRLILPSTTDHSNLQEECTIDGWTYYSNPLDAIPANRDKWIFAIRKNIQSTEPQFNVSLGSAPNVIRSLRTASPASGSYLMKRYWNVELISGTIDNGIDIRFYYDPADLADAANDRDADMAIYGGTPGPHPQWFKTNAASGGFDPSLLVTQANGNDWDFPSDSLTQLSTISTQLGFGNNNITYVQFDGLTSLSGGTGGTSFGENNPLLPVELVSFIASAREVDIKLDWITANELNNDKFEVLRSEDAILFEKIGEVDGNGTTFEVSNYSYIDEDVLPGRLYYYKLNQLDFDGTAEESNIVTAIINLENKMIIGELVPNPANSYSTIEIISPMEDEFQILITNMLGREIDYLDYRVVPGSQQISIDVNNMAPGNYLITIQSTTGMAAIRKLQVIK